MDPNSHGLESSRVEPGRVTRKGDIPVDMEPREVCSTHHGDKQICVVFLSILLDSLRIVRR